MKKYSLNQLLLRSILLISILNLGGCNDKNKEPVPPEELICLSMLRETVPPASIKSTLDTNPIEINFEPYFFQFLNSDNESSEKAKLNDLLKKYPFTNQVSSDFSLLFNNKLKSFILKGNKQTEDVPRVCSNTFSQNDSNELLRLFSLLDYNIYENSSLKKEATCNFKEVSDCSWLGVMVNYSGMTVKYEEHRNKANLFLSFFSNETNGGYCDSELSNNEFKYFKNILEGSNSTIILLEVAKIIANYSDLECEENL